MVSKINGLPPDSSYTTIDYISLDGNIDIGFQLFTNLLGYRCKMHQRKVEILKKRKIWGIEFRQRGPLYLLTH